MAIKRTVETDVYCDICGAWIIGWRSNDTGTSKIWAAYFARKKAAQLGKRLFAKSAGSRSGSRYAVYSEKSEVREETVMEHAWDLEAKHQTSRWRSANGALRAHLTRGKNSSEDRSRNGQQ